MERYDKMGIDRCGHDPKHSPRYLENRLPMNFPLSLRFDIKVVWRKAQVIFRM